MRPFQKTALWLAFSFCLALVLGVTAARLGFNAYLNSAGFRQKIAAMAGRALKAQSEFQPLHLSGATIYTDGFAAQSTGGAFFSELSADQLRADFNWHGLLRRAWQIDQIDVQRLAVQFAPQRPETKPRPPDENVTKPVSAGWTLDLRQAVIHDSRWTWGGADATAGSLAGVALTLTPSAGAWLIAAEGGRLAQTGWPELRLDTARLRYQPPSLFISESTLHSGGGTVAATGEIDFSRQADLQIELTALDVAPLLTADWRARLTGKISAKIHLLAPFGEPGGTASRDLSLEGSAHLSDAQLTALPVLDQIATFTQTERFRQFALTRASLDFTRKSRQFSARNVVAESEGLLRVEGAFTVTDGRIDGTFQIGVTSASLQWLPGSQSRIFTVARGGYLWTPMRLTGPVDHPKEDLTPRLLTVAGGEVLKNVEGTVRETTKGVLDLLLH